MAFVLVTGGAGYIGSHTVVELCSAGFKPVIFDNFSNSCAEAIKRVEEITGHIIPFVEGDLLDKIALEAVFQKYAFNVVIHFAGLKSVGESGSMPLHYYTTNMTGTINLVEVMRAHNVQNLIFSSSATVYGNQVVMPLNEASMVGGCTNVYGRTKYFVEEILRDVCSAYPNFKVILLRYFNPIGAHPCGRIGEDPKGIPNNLLPFVAQVAVGRRPHLSIFGSDYNTADGTGVRDYIHVVDLALGHVAAIKSFSLAQGCSVYNLGSGVGYSVLEIVAAFSKACGQEIKYVLCPRRQGDCSSVYADPSKAFKELGWKTEKTLDEMCLDSWRWQSSNPFGYAGAPSK